MHSGSEREDRPLEIRSKIWIERGEGVVLSEWRVELLEAIEATGSLSRAAEALDVPYRTAWERVKATEAELGVRLLESESGGADGGGSRLTAEARDFCRRFRRVSGGIQEVVSRRFAAEFGDRRSLSPPNPCSPQAPLHWRGESPVRPGEGELPRSEW